MKQYGLYRRLRIALAGTALVVAGTALLMGSGAIAARPSMAQATARTTMPSMAHMEMSQAAGAQGTVGSTIVRLHQTVVRVSISNFAFRPARLVVSPGTRIVWTNKDGDPHTVDSTKGLWASEALDTGSQFARVFKKTGTFAYFCSIHPFMHGTITVKS